MGASAETTYTNFTTSTIQGLQKVRSEFEEDDWELESPPQFFPFEFENFDRRWWLAFARQNWHLSVTASVIYICAIFGIQAYMRDRPAFKLKKALFVWNGALGIFSILGFVRFVPEFMNVLFNHGVHGSLCRREGLNMPLAYWS